MMMMMMARRRWSDTARRRVHRRSAMAMTTRASATRRINPFVGSRTNVSRGKSSVKRATRRVAATAGESEVFRAWDQATKSEKRTDIKKIMILGAGPIVIGQVRGDTRDRGGGADRATTRGTARGRADGWFLKKKDLKMSPIGRDEGAAVRCRGWEDAIERTREESWTLGFRSCARY